jgi:DNA-binding NarL/FixJ family response regulator
LLREFPVFKVIGEAKDGKELLLLMQEESPDVVLLDIKMPVMDGHRTHDLIKRRHPNTKVIILSFYDEFSYIGEFIIKGAHGYLKKNENIEIVAKAIHTVNDGDFYFDKKISSAVIDSLIKSAHKYFEQLKLSLLEIDILRQICEEKTSAEIAQILGITEKAIEYHRGNIYERTGAKTLAGLIRFANKHGIFTFD